MLGNGTTWALICTYPAKRSSSGAYTLRRQRPSAAYFKLLESLPTLAGIGINSDLQEYREFLEDVSGRSQEESPFMVNFKQPVELATLAAVAGYKFDYSCLLYTSPSPRD